MGWSDLDQCDASAVMSLVDEVRSSRTLDDYADTAMHGLAELIECQDVSYNEMDPVGQRVNWKVTPDHGPLLEEFAPTFARLMRQNPLIRHFEETGDTRALMWTDLVTTEEMRQTELYQEMFKHLGVDHQMALTLPAPHGIVIGFAVNSPEPFDERDRAVMNTLRPYLSHTYRSIQLGDELSAIRRALHAGGWAAALANGDGEVQHAINGAEDAFASLDIDLREGELLPQALLEEFVPGVAGYDPSLPAVPSRGARLSEEADGVDGWYVPSPLGPHVVLVQTRVDASRRRLEDAGLSPRQITVALHLAAGGTNRVIADRLGIAEGTVRKHLERVYRSLGVEDRASAIAAIKGW